MKCENVIYISAPLGKRFGAALLDALIALSFSLPACLCLFYAIIRMYQLNVRHVVLLLIVALVFICIPIVYTLFKDGLGKGQSWGKRAFKLQVLQEDLSKPCSYKKSFVRNGVMLLLINLLPLIGSLVEPIVMFTSDNRKRLGDKAAKTIVVEITNNHYADEL